MPSRPLGTFTIAALAAMLLPGIVLGFDGGGGRSAPMVNAAANIKRLLERDYYSTASDRLSIDQVASGEVQRGVVPVSGAVQIQGTQILLDGQSRTLANAILRAGSNGWSDLRKVQVTRFHKDGSKLQFRVDVQRINEMGNAEGTDPVLQDGDRVHVPTRRI